MALVNITNIIVEDNPANFLEPLKFKITFETSKEIPEEIEWQLIYIGSAKDEKYDQVLDSFSMGPLASGIMQFVIETNPPDPQKIPSKDDLLGVTAVVLTVSFRKKEFFRCGYYVYNSYTDPELIESDPEEVIISKVQRNILADKPRITRFAIDWGQEDLKTHILKEFEEENSKEDKILLQDKTNFAEMKNDLFKNFDKKMIDGGNVNLAKQMNEFTIGSVNNKESNPFLE